MMGKLKVLVLTVLLITNSFGAAGSSGLYKEGAASGSVEGLRQILLAQRRSCQAVSTLWYQLVISMLLSLILDDQRS